MMLRVHILLAASLAVAGCDRSPYQLAPVHGTVTVADKPMFQGKVMFGPIARPGEENPGKPAFGAIQADGQYRLTTFNPDDGAIVGEHWATIINVEEDLPDGVPEFARVTYPEKVTVVPGQDNRIDLRFSRETIRKYREDDR
jgi:hypothetical protein